MLHEPAAPVGDDPAYPYERRLGVWLFLAHSALYAAFVLANLAAPTTMEARVLAGVNLDTVLGLGLIVLAVVHALAYTPSVSSTRRRWEVASAGPPCRYLRLPRRGCACPVLLLRP